MREAAESGLPSSATAPQRPSCTKKGIEIDYNRAAIIENFVAVFSKAVGYTGGFKIKAADHQKKHVGLGSTSTVMMAVATAINEAVGAPLTNAELRRLIGHNYVEETADGKIAFGFETGVGRLRARTAAWQ